MKAMARSIARRLLGPYAIYRIYEHRPPRSPLPATAGLALAPLRGGDELELARSPDPELRALAGYAGEGAYGFGARVDGELAAACWFWAGQRYRARNFWPLRDDEAKLVQVTTAARFRGLGIAPRLIADAASRMGVGGYRRLFARVWHSNRPSIASFEKAGWAPVTLVVEIHPPGTRSPRRLVLGRRRG